LKYLHENGCPWDEYTCSKAASGGHLECLKYAHENGCPWNKETCSGAAERDHLECLKYAHENGCPWDWRTRVAAAYYGHLECFQYLHENGYSANASIVNRPSLAPNQPNQQNQPQVDINSVASSVEYHKFPKHADIDYASAKQERKRERDF